MKAYQPMVGPSGSELTQEHCTHDLSCFKGKESDSGTGGIISPERCLNNCIAGRCSQVSAIGCWYHETKYKTMLQWLKLPSLHHVSMYRSPNIFFLSCMSNFNRIMPTQGSVQRHTSSSPPAHTQNNECVPAVLPLVLPVLRPASFETSHP